ncbi:hypothetical protein FNJ84_17680 [Paracoccus sp. M683]|uniref:hypothetical protein n=1 Tax=Paracoccus sp. M683 TaxID=2594268 RepID=UPI00117E9971|nr:hypothetical protein [Paracoccus sp. M683]TRW94923.1 hypothetical protein FNJ84_17680 [Paracoccus sp. M683]
MPLARLNTLLPLILPKATNCPPSVAAQQARMAAIEFCERTRCWRQVSTVTVTGPNEALTVAPPEAAIYEIESASFGEGDTPLYPTQHTDLLGMRTGRPAYITQVSPNQVTIFPFDQAVDLDISLFLKPRVEDEYGTDPLDPLFNRYDVVPDWMLTQHGHRLVDGALGRILAIPNQPWTDMARAGYHAGLFNDACNAKFHQQVRGQQRARARSRFQDF